MSIDLSGAASIQARMASIQNRFQQMGGAASTSLPTQPTSAPAPSGSFADALASFTPAADVAPSSAAGPAFASSRAVPSAAGSTDLGAQVVSDAQRYLGVPYRWGGTDPATGLDCSGLVQRVYGDLGVDLPRVAHDQARAGQPVASLAEALPGDLLAFGSPVDHIGIYAGDGKMVVAPKTGDVVKLQTVYRTPTAIRRVLPGPPAAQAFARSAALAAAPAALQPLFAAAGARYGVSPDLLAGVARAESGFDPAARSGVGALGLMQIMPGTARSLGVDPLDPAQAVDGAARLLAGHLRSYGGSVPLALAAYNAGPGAVARYGGVPPYRETQSYVQKILSYLDGAAA